MCVHVCMCVGGVSKDDLHETVLSFPVWVLDMVLRYSGLVKQVHLPAKPLPDPQYRL